MSQGERYGWGIYGNGWRAVARCLRVGTGLRALAAAGAGGTVMMAATTQAIGSGWMVLAAVLAGALLVYLIAVLLRPEDFS